MRGKRSSIPFMRFAVIWFSALTVVTLAAVCAWFVTTVRAGGSPMAGDWVGICQDGRAFMMVTLRPAAGGYGGTISLGNVKITSHPSKQVYWEPRTSRPGAVDGSCSVNDAATPEHAMKITKAVAAGGMLTIDSEHGQEYEMKMRGSDTAKLRFVGTNRDESWFVVRRR